MSISPQLVCMTSVAGLLGGSSVVGLGMCCGPLLVAFAALHAPAEPPADVVAVVLAAPFAAVDVLELLFPHPATETARTAAIMARTGRDMGAQDNQGPREAVSPPGRIRQRAPRPRWVRLGRRRRDAPRSRGGRRAARRGQGRCVRDQRRAPLGRGLRAQALGP